MSSSLAERLSAERHRRFVGRKRELELFQSAIAASNYLFMLRFWSWWRRKTSLLRQFIHICNSSETQLIYVDARNIEPTAESLISALRTIMG